LAAVVAVYLVLKRSMRRLPSTSTYFVTAIWSDRYAPADCWSVLLEVLKKRVIPVSSSVGSGLKRSVGPWPLGAPATRRSLRNWSRVSRASSRPTLSVCFSGPVESSARRSVWLMRLVLSVSVSKRWRPMVVGERPGPDGGKRGLVGREKRPTCPKRRVFVTRTLSLKRCSSVPVAMCALTRDWSASRP
jgi:hypothetical protein